MNLGYRGGGAYGANMVSKITTIFLKFILKQSMYGMPQSNSYGQYGFGYQGFGQTEAPGSPPTGSSAQAGSASGATQAQGQAGTTGQAGQAQWGTDPSFYQNYWGGQCCDLPSLAN